MGLSAAQEAELLEATFRSGTLWLRLLMFTGTPAVAPGMLPAKDGSLPAGLVEPTSGGYAPIAVTPAQWELAFAQVSTASTIAVPQHGQPTIGWTPSVSWQNVVAYAWTTDANPIGPTNYLSSDSFIDLNNVDPTTNQPLPVALDAAANQFFGWGDGTQLGQIVERFGGTPPGVNPT